MISNIQHLRGFAALCIVFFHTLALSQSYQFSFGYLGSLNGIGEFGVDLFFVISGFIMMHIQSRKPKSTISFIKSRIIRIVPLYWVLTSLLFIAVLIAPSVMRGLEVSASYYLASLFFVSQISFQGVFFPGDQFPLLYVGWSLEWEMLFYMLFALAISTRNWLVGSFFVAIALTFVAVNLDRLIIMEFVLGMIVGFIYEHKTISRNVARGLIVCGLAAFLFWAFNQTKPEEVDRLFKWGIPAFLIVLGSLYVTQVKNALLNLLGDASYSIYLVQVFTISLFYKIAVSLVPDWNTDLLNILCVIFSVACGIGCYYLLENPMTAWLRSQTKD